ncbi:Hypothetical Protein FCC1311_106232 [Hondaea fermentalgiana]|uniref:Uncharacterized protein n=1 Tax=Hondaea fermentalgiana TaxID=2315210 RepID=A0A2R5GVP7_9STRA|nr:Hypothetical Protein FCC1311_106232 [Hondaea fermentalgiana]|eukprot:GBG34399.1 Hypothetical Protein FCC1311_106232 [Hondaea fermentalgiana]
MGRHTGPRRSTAAVIAEKKRTEEFKRKANEAMKRLVDASQKMTDTVQRIRNLDSKLVIKSSGAASAQADETGHEAVLDVPPRDADEQGVAKDTKAGCEKKCSSCSSCKACDFWSDVYKDRGYGDCQDCLHEKFCTHCSGGKCTISCKRKAAVKIKQEPIEKESKAVDAKRERSESNDEQEQRDAKKSKPGCQQRCATCSSCDSCKFWSDKVRFAKYCDCQECGHCDHCAHCTSEECTRADVRAAAKKIKQVAMQQGPKAEQEDDTKAKVAWIKAHLGMEDEATAEPKKAAKVVEKVRRHAEEAAKADAKAGEDVERKADADKTLAEQKDGLKAEVDRLKAQLEIERELEREATANAKKAAKVLAEARLNAEQARLKAEQDVKLKADQEVKLKDGQAKLKDGQAKLKADQAKLKADQDELKAEQAKLKDGQAKLKADQAKLKTDQAKLKADQDELKAKKDEFEAGEDAKRKAEQEAELKAKQVAEPQAAQQGQQQQGQQQQALGHVQRDEGMHASLLVRFQEPLEAQFRTTDQNFLEYAKMHAFSMDRLVPKINDGTDGATRLMIRGETPSDFLARSKFVSSVEGQALSKEKVSAENVHGLDVFISSRIMGNVATKNAYPVEIDAERVAELPLYQARQAVARMVAERVATALDGGPMLGMPRNAWSQPSCGWFPGQLDKIVAGISAQTQCTFLIDCNERIPVDVKARLKTTNHRAMESIALLRETIVKAVKDHVMQETRPGGALDIPFRTMKFSNV